MGLAIFGQRIKRIKKGHSAVRFIYIAVQKGSFFITDYFSTCEQILSFRRICFPLIKEAFTKNSICCTMQDKFSLKEGLKLSITSVKGNVFLAERKSNKLSEV